LKKKPSNIQALLKRQGAYTSRLIKGDVGMLAFLKLHQTASPDLELLSLLWAQTEADQDVFPDRLRRFKTRIMLLIFLQEVSGISMPICAANYSALADFCIQIAIAYYDLEEGFCVIGLGKLGGEELNYGSDIDILFVSQQDNFSRLKQVEQCVALLDEPRSGGRVFRVDLRLRPEGSVGPLVQSKDRMVEYYQNWGREWERGMLLKARWVAGDSKLAEQFVESLRPFVFRTALDYRAIGALEKMKAAIEAQAEYSHVHGAKVDDLSGRQKKTSPLLSKLNRKLGRAPRNTKAKEKANPRPLLQPKANLLAWDIKIGRGGIREIEFFVQALQLVHGGRSPRLRVRGTLDALKRLFASGLLSEKDALTMEDAYIFFRVLEHRVQMREGKQTHRLPDSFIGLEALAASMDVDVATLESDILEKRKEVHLRFGRLFSKVEKHTKRSTVDEDMRWSALLVVGVDRLSKTRTIDILQSKGFKRPRDAAYQLALIQQKRFGPFYEASELAVYCLACCAQAPDPDMAMANLVRFFQTVGDRPAFYDMLATHPHATRLLIHIFGVSHTFSGQLIRDPNLFTRLVRVGTLAFHRSSLEVQKELDARLKDKSDPDHRIGVIRRFKQEETLRIALHYIGGVSQESSTFLQLSDLADVVVNQLLSEVYEGLCTEKRRVMPKNEVIQVLPDLCDLPFTIIASGKWGSRELSFSSDLDLFFVYQEDRQFRIGHDFFTKLASRLMRQLSWQSAYGSLYEVDARLRPSGNKGALVVSLGALQSYHRTSDLWERQALLRARACPTKEDVSGRKKETGCGVAISFSTLREDILSRAYPNEASEESAFKAHFVKMFKKIEDVHYRKGDRNPKYQPGGMIAAEFSIQYLQFRWGVDALSFEKNVNALTKVMPKEICEVVDFSALIDDYHFLRRVDAYLKITNTTSNVLASGEALVALSRRVRIAKVADFLERYDAAIDRIQSLWTLLFL